MPTTTNLSITIPTVGGSNNTWGDELNAALQSLDDLFVTAGSGTSVGLNVGSGKTLTLAGTGTISGTANVSGTLNASSGTMVLPQGASAAPTAEGSIAWDTDDNLLKIGDGSSTQSFINTAAGTWTPTITGVSNVASSTSATCQYLRVGNVVVCSGAVQIDPTSATYTVFALSLPIASNFSASSNLGGNVGGLLNAEAGPIEADTTNDRAQCSITLVNSTNQTLAFQFTYRVI